jgi:hypothetical protein
MPLRSGIGVGVSFGGNPYAGIIKQLGFAPGIPSVSNGSVVPAGPTAVPGWSFSRASAGYGASSSGLLTPFLTNVPRITNQGLLVEAAATNVITNNRDLTNVSWTKQASVTATASAIASPDGTVAGTLLSTGDGTNLRGAFVVAGGSPATPSFWINRVSTSGTIFAGNPTATVDGTWSINLALLNPGWNYVTVNHPAVTVVNAWTAPGGIYFYSTAVLGYYVDLAQVETGPVASSPIVTAGAAATRAADVASITFSGTPAKAIITYGAGLTATINSPTSPLNLGASSGGAWVGSYVSKVVVK